MLCTNTDDPMADLIAGGLACGEFAVQNPQLYRLLFGLTDLGGVHKLSADAATPWDLAEGVDALSVLVAAVERVNLQGNAEAQADQIRSSSFLSTESCGSSAQRSASDRSRGPT